MRLLQTASREHRSRSSWKAIAPWLHTLPAEPPAPSPHTAAAPSGAGPRQSTAQTRRPSPARPSRAFPPNDRPSSARTAPPEPEEVREEEAQAPPLPTCLAQHPCATPHRQAAAKRPSAAPLTCGCRWAGEPRRAPRGATTSSASASARPRSARRGSEPRPRGTSVLQRPLAARRSLGPEGA